MGLLEVDISSNPDIDADESALKDSDATANLSIGGVEFSSSSSSSVVVLLEVDISSNPDIDADESI